MNMFPVQKIQISHHALFFPTGQKNHVLHCISSQVCGWTDKVVLRVRDVQSETCRETESSFQVEILLKEIKVAVCWINALSL